MTNSSFAKRVKNFLRTEYIDARLFWGLRMAISLTIPMVWGLVTGRMAEAEWIALAAESLCWLDLKGSLSQKIRLLVAGLLVVLVSGLVGGFAGHYTWAAVLAMLVVGFISGLFRNLGDRGSGLAFVLNVYFILNLAFPFTSSEMVGQRVIYTLVGSGIAIAVSFFATALHPTQQPYRSMLANIWLAISELTEKISTGWNGSEKRAGVREIYEKEMHVRTQLNTSLHFFSSLAHEVKKTEEQKLTLAQIRRASSLVATHIISIADELERVSIHTVVPELRVHLHEMLESIGRATYRLSLLLVDVRDEDYLLLETRLERLKKLNKILSESSNLARYPDAFQRLLLLTGRIEKLLFYTAERLLILKKDVRSFHSYSLVKTMVILNPKYLLENLKLLLNFNTFTTRYALRLAIAASFSVWLWQHWDIAHGHWMPFTVAVVVQPYFGATWRKAIDRTLGTILGAVVAGLLLYLPDIDWLEIIILFIASVLMVYYVKDKYSYAAFFMTVGLILLFEVNDDANPLLIIDRASITAAGSVIAIIAGFAILPTWDKRYLPKFLKASIEANHAYFLRIFYDKNLEERLDRFKQKAETANSNAFDSFNRYMNEPRLGKQTYHLFYLMITQNIKLTHELNKMQLFNPISKGAPATDAENRISYATKLFDQASKKIDEINGQSNAIKNLETGLLPQKLVLNYDQVYFLEKIIIELSALNADLNKWKQQVGDNT